MIDTKTTDSEVGHSGSEHDFVIFLAEPNPIPTMVAVSGRRAKIRSTISDALSIQQRL